MNINELKQAYLNTLFILTPLARAKTSSYFTFLEKYYLNTSPKFSPQIGRTHPTTKQ